MEEKRVYQTVWFVIIRNRDLSKNKKQKYDCMSMIGKIPLLDDLLISL